jgi:hypothetical protein
VLAVRDRWVTVAADQLTDKQIEALKKRLFKYIEVREAEKAAWSKWGTLLHQFEKVNEPCPALSELKKARTAARKTREDSAKAAKLLLAMDEARSKKLCASKEVDKGTRWLIGGTCAS